MDWEISDLNPNEAISILYKGLDYSSISLNIKGDKLGYLADLKKSELQSVELNIIECKSDTTWEGVKSTFSGLKSVKSLNEMSICGLTHQAEIVLKHCENCDAKCSVDLKLLNIKKSCISYSTIIKLKPLMRNLQLYFHGEKFAELITSLRKDIHLPFSLMLKGLSYTEAIGILDKVKDIFVPAEDVRQSKQTLLNELFANEWMPVAELWEFQLRGLLILCEFNENAPIPWFSIGCVVALAAVQMAIGGVLIATGFGATLGMSLITEGAADVFTAYRAFSNRQFSWEDYAKQKAISLAISAVSMGLGKLKDAAKGAKVAVEGAVKEVGEQATTQILMKGKGAVTEVLKSSGANLKALAVKQMGVAVAEAGAREGLNALMTMGSQLVIAEMKPQIKQTVEKRVVEKFYTNAELKKIMGFFWALDSISNSNELGNKIKAIVGEITNPKSSFWTSQWNSVGLPLLQGVLSSSQNVGGYASWGFRIFGILNGLREISYVIQAVAKAIVDKLKSENMTLVHNLLVYKCRMPIKEAQKLVHFIQLDTSEPYFKYTVGQLQNRGVSEFFMKLNSLQTKFSMEKVELTIADMTNSLSDHIIRIADTQMRAPVTTFLVGKGVANLSTFVQSNFVISSKHNTTDLEGKDQITVADQINANAKEYTVAYQQIDINKKINKIDSDTTNSTKPSDQVLDKVKGMAKDDPADLATMSTLAKVLGKELTIVTDKDQVQLQETDSPNKITVLYEAGPIDPLTGKQGIGHYSLVDSKTGEIIPNQTQGNDCGYEVFAQASGGSVSVGELRLKGASFVLDHASTYDKVIDNGNWVASRYPQEANAFLFVGAGDRKGKRQLVLSGNDDEREKRPKSQNDNQELDKENIDSRDKSDKKISIESKKEGKLRKCSPEDDREVDLPIEFKAEIPFGTEGKNVPIKEWKGITKELDKLTGKGKSCRMHFANARTGAGTEDNLMPGGKSMNSRHYHDFEQFYLDLRKQIKDFEGELILKGKVTYPQSDYVQPAETLTCSIGTSNPKAQAYLDKIFGPTSEIGGNFTIDERKSGRTDYTITFKRTEPTEPVRSGPGELHFTSSEGEY